jgi:putative hemin transport protein
MPATLSDVPTTAVDRREALRRGFADARAAGPVRHRDAAARLGVSEGELIAAHAQAAQVPRAPHARTAPSNAGAGSGLSAERLAPRWPAILRALPTLGEVMALTRNASCVHEKTGRYEDVQAEGDNAAMGLVLGPDIDLRVFFRRWAHGFAVHEGFADPGKPAQRSLQFFDASGTAVHKVFARPNTDLAAWHQLVQRFTADAAQAAAPFGAPPAPRVERADHEIDSAAFRAGWAGLRDTHEFFGLLGRHGLTRTQALRLAEPRFAHPVDPGSARELLRAAAAAATPIMVFVGNPGMIQIHTGRVHRVEIMGPWLNVLDAGFNLHLREDHIASAWVVRKPTSDGIVTSLELFDTAGQTIAMLFGERKPGRSELCAWRQLTDRVVGDPAWAGEDAACAAC